MHHPLGIVVEYHLNQYFCSIFKKNSRLETRNYRPVSILVVISKILEKSVYIQFEKYLVDNKLLYNFQSGFSAAHSTDTTPQVTVKKKLILYH
jgi:hypothetical protein